MHDFRGETHVERRERRRRRAHVSTDNRNAWKAPRKSLCITQLSFFFSCVDRGIFGPHLESEDVKFVGKHPPPPVAFFGVRQTGGESCARVSVRRPPPHLFLFAASLRHRARLLRSCESSALPQVVLYYPRTDDHSATPVGPFGCEAERFADINRSSTFL